MNTREHGFTLLEVLFATTIVTVAISALAQAMTMATRTNAASRSSTSASLLAIEKMESLRATAQMASPPNALTQDVEGYCDFLDANGAAIASGVPRDRAIYIRRWSVDALPSHPATTLVMQVVVTSVSYRSQTRIVGVQWRPVAP